MAEKWIQKAINPKHVGWCTPMTKSTCTGARRRLAQRFKSGDLSKKNKQEGGVVESGSKLGKISTIAGLVGTGLEITGAIGDSVTKAMIDKILAGSPEQSDIRSAKDAVSELKRRQSGARRAETTGSLLSLNPGRILGSLLGAKSGRQIEQKERMDLKEKLSNEALANYLRSQASTEYCRGGRVKGKLASGGKIKGKGTAKSDSINMRSKEGSFIVPAVNNSVAMAIGRNYLGWGKNQTAKKNKGGVAIAASKGEVEYNPEEVKALLAEGINLNKLAPDSSTPLKLKRGGKVRRYKKHPSAAKAAEMLDNPPHGKRTKKQTQYFRALAEGWVPGYTDGGPVAKPDSKMRNVVSKVSAAMAKKPREKKSEEEKKERREKIWGEIGGIGGILGGVQAGVGAYSLLRMGEGPQLTVADELKQLARDTRRESTYGLEPFVRNKAREDLLRSRNEMIRTLAGRGSGGQELSANLSRVNRAYSEGVIELAKADFSAQEAKKAVHRQFLGSIAARKHDIQTSKRAIFDRNEEALAGMLASGIENVVGARKLKEHMDFLKENR